IVKCYCFFWVRTAVFKYIIPLLLYTFYNFSAFFPIYLPKMRAANGGFAVEDKGPAGGQPGAAKGVKKNNLPPHVSRPTPPKPHLPQSPYLKTIRFGILDCQGCTSCAEYTRLALDNRIHAGFFPYGGLGNTAIRAYKTP